MFQFYDIYGILIMNQFNWYTIVMDAIHIVLTIGR